MRITEHAGDPLDRITHHVTNLWRVWKGEPVRDLAESEAGYESAMRELRGAVGERDEALRFLRELTLRDGNSRAVARTLVDVRAFLDRVGGQ